MTEKITIFHAKKTQSKTPISPYNDNTFVFETYNCTTNLQMYNVLASHFILNIPLHQLNKPIRTFRRKINLDPYYSDKITYLILDIDDVKSEFNKQKILDYFKNYRVILGESKNHNNINNFNMKGILYTESIDFKDIKRAISYLHHELKDYCTIDESVVRKASLNAPIMKSNIFINNEDGIRFQLIKQDTVQHIDNIQKEYYGNNIEINIDQLKDTEADSIEKLCLITFQTMGFVAIKNNPNGSITFKHPDEKKTLGGYFWFGTSPYTMHHGNSTKSINIFESIRKLDQAKELMKKEINYVDELMSFNTNTSVINVNEKYLVVTPEINSKIQEFINHDNGLFSIKSPMGTGKSTIINHIIQECHDQDMRVLIITNRISVAHDFGKKYNIKVYNLDKYEIGDSLICQYDSLYKYNIKFFDIVIMDEFISLMMHSRSNINNNSLNIAKFFGSFNKKLVIADAFLTGYENFLLSNKKHNIHLIDNCYRDDTQLFSYTDYNFFVNSLLYHSEKHKITVSSTSLSFIHSLEMVLTKRGLKVVTLTAETPESTKKLIYGLFEQSNHDKWDVIIYSPTLTVGVSNLNDIYYHFHYDSSMSTDVISSIQMIKRTRKTKEIHMHVKEKINYVQTSYNSIRDEYMNNVGRHAYSYLFDVDDYGEIKLSEVGKKAIKIDTFKNILEFNHKNAMYWLLRYQFMNNVETISNVFSGNVLNKYAKQIKDQKHQILLSSVNQFLNLNDIEKSAILLESDADKTLKILAEIDTNIKECAPEIKSKILEKSLIDDQFITKSKYYKIAFNFTKKIYDESDIKNIVRKLISKSNNDDLHFYSTLLNYGQKEIFDEYTPKHINKNKNLKYILDKCGYYTQKQSSPDTVGHRGYVVDPDVKKYHVYFK